MSEPWTSSKPRLAIGATAFVRAFPAPWIVFGFFALLFGPGVFCNALFHAGASVASRTYCPGLVTGLAVYLPLSLLLAGLAVREGLVGAPLLLVALVVAAAFQTLEVRHHVFERW